MQLVGANEGAVQSVRHAAGQLHGGLRLHLAGVHHHQLRPAALLVVHEAQHVAVVLGAGVGARHEAWLAAVPAFPVDQLLHRAGLEVDLREARHARPWLGDGEVGVPRLPAEQLPVHHAGLEVHLVGLAQHGAPPGLARARVEADLREHAAEALVRGRLVEHGVRRRHAGADHHDLAGGVVLPRVPEVEAEAVGDLHPPELRCVGGALREHAEPRRLVLVVHHRRAAAHHLLELEHDLLVRDDGIVLGDGEVVDHRRRVDGDVDVGGLAAVGGEVEVLEVRLGHDI
uniref:Uncharacterized protein n=1 Tax=Oryza brachyantha TaxID=4533 RepID=J3MIN0_ORYBR